MKTYPLHSISLEQAKQLQFKVIDAVTRNFQGEEVLSLGDLGVVKGLNKPRCTVKVEKVFADTFDAPAALLVRGSGTGAIRWALTACLKPGDAILVHTSPIYTTTQVTIMAKVSAAISTACQNSTISARTSSALFSCFFIRFTPFLCILLL